MARPKHPPVISVLGRGGGAYGCIEIALELCAWVNIDLKIWGLRTLTKVLTGKPITNADRAEGWAKVSQLGLNLEVEAPTSKSIESDVSPELADSFRKTEWVIRKALELGTSAEEVQKIFLNFESAKPKTKSDRTPNAVIKIKEVKTPKSPHYQLVKDWFAECLEFDRDSSVQMGADRDIPSQLYGSFSKFLINKGCDQQISHSAFSATLKEFVGLELKSNPSIRFKSPNNKRTLYGVRLR